MLIIMEAKRLGRCGQESKNDSMCSYINALAIKQMRLENSKNFIISL